MDFNNKIVWITGASNGIGKQLALDLSRRNCKLILSSRNREKLEEVKTECLKHCPFVEVIPLDLTQYLNLQPKAELAVKAFGKVDVLINCGGISQRSLIIDTDITVDKKLMEVDYLGTVAVSKAILPHFVKNRSGVFVVVSSVMGMFGSPYRSGYSAAKHALHGFFDVLRMEHEKDGIQVTIICPGFVNTDVTRNAVTGKGGRYGQQDEKTEHGLEVGVFTKKMIHAIEKEKFEAYIGRKEALAVFLKRFFPKLLHKIVLRSKVR